MKKFVLLAALAIGLVACTPPTGLDARPDDDRWAYINGPNGEHCLVVREGWGNTQMMGMECDTVNWDER